MDQVKAKPKFASLACIGVEVRGSDIGKSRDSSRLAGSYV